MSEIMIDRRTFLAGLGASLLVGCAPSKPLGTYETTEVAAPTWKVGQRWIYKRTDGFTKLPRGTLTRSVVSVETGRIELVTRNENDVVLDDSIFSEPGIELSGTLSEEGPIVGRIEPRWRRYDFPLVAGKRWSDTFYVNRTDNQGTRNYVQVSTRVEGWDDVTIGSRTYRAIILRRFWNLGPRSFWNGTLYRDEIEWYAPAIGATVRWETSEEYVERRNAVMGPMMHGDRFLYFLESTNVL